jgi:hypothetical protein
MRNYIASLSILLLFLGCEEKSSNQEKVEVEELMQELCDSSVECNSLARECESESNISGEIEVRQDWVSILEIDNNKTIDVRFRLAELLIERNGTGDIGNALIELKKIEEEKPTVNTLEEVFQLIIEFDTDRVKAEYYEKMFYQIKQDTSYLFNSANLYYVIGDFNKTLHVIENYRYFKYKKEKYKELDIKILQIEASSYLYLGEYRKAIERFYLLPDEVKVFQIEDSRFYYDLNKSNLNINCSNYKEVVNDSLSELEENLSNLDIKIGVDKEATDDYFNNRKDFCNKENSNILFKIDNNLTNFLQVYSDYKIGSDIEETDVFTINGQTENLNDLHNSFWGFYHFNQRDFQKSKEYFEKISLKEKVHFYYLGEAYFQIYVQTENELETSISNFEKLFSEIDFNGNENQELNSENLQYLSSLEKLAYLFCYENKDKKYSESLLTILIYIQEDYENEEINRLLGDIKRGNNDINCPSLNNFSKFL